MLANRVDQSLLRCLTHPVRQQAGSYRFDAQQAGPKVRQCVGRFECSAERVRQQASSNRFNSQQAEPIGSAVCSLR